jgi:hypothetical protein
MKTQSFREIRQTNVAKSKKFKNKKLRMKAALKMSLSK